MTRSVLVNVGDKGYELAIFDKKRKCDWFEAIEFAKKFKGGWRLPLDFELESIFKSPVLQGVLKNDSYWSLTETANNRARSQVYRNGGDFRKIWYSDPGAIEDKNAINYIFLVRSKRFLSDKTIKFIDSSFNYYSEGYDLKKYPISIYKTAQNQFSKLKADENIISSALIWKWGYLRKTSFPSKQAELIKKIQSQWKYFVKSDACDNPFQTFSWWQSFGKRTGSSMYITSVFITHLIHYKKNIPIIDQHNYRAINYLLNNCKFNRDVKLQPSSWLDVINLQQLINKIHNLYPHRSFEDIDKYLMILGKDIKYKIKK